MEFTPHTRRAFNRLNEHTLVVTRRGMFQGSLAVLTRCVDTDCPNVNRDGARWAGWFTDSELCVAEILPWLRSPPIRPKMLVGCYLQSDDIIRGLYLDAFVEQGYLEATGEFEEDEQRD